MVAAADPAGGFFASRHGRALALGCSFTACLLAAGALTITLLGHPGTSPAIRLELAQEAAAHKPAAPLRFSSNEGPAVPPVTKPLYAGKVLLLKGMRTLGPLSTGSAKSLKRLTLDRH